MIPQISKNLNLLIQKCISLSMCFTFVFSFIMWDDFKMVHFYSLELL